MKALKRGLSLLLVLVLALALTACGGGKTETPETDTPSAGTGTTAPSTGSTSPAKTDAPETQTKNNDAKYGGVFVKGQSVAPSSLFYIHMTGSANGFCSPCNEPIGRYNPDTGHYDPFLVESYEENVADASITLHLRKGIKFHDGSELTASVLQWNLQYMIDAGQGANISNPIGFETPDDYTLVVKYENYSVDFFDKLAVVMISSQKAFEDNGLEYCQNHPVGTGPFKFEEYVPDNYISYVRNDDYWQEGLPYLDGYKVQIITEWAAMMTAFANGEVDTFVCGDDSTITALQAMGFEDQSKPTLTGYTLFGVNPNSRVEGDPFYKKEVRQAVLLYGIDWNEVCLLSGGPTAVVSLQPCIEHAVGYNAELEKESYYDLEKAKQMLADAGYPDGFHTTIHSTAPNLPLAVAMQDALKKLNITADVNEITFSDPVRWDGVTPGLHLTNGYSASDVIAKPLSTWWCSTSTTYGKNILFPPEYDELLAKGSAVTTWEERQEIAEQLLRILCVDSCLYRVCNMKQGATFINPAAHDSGSEYNVATPELTWKEK